MKKITFSDLMNSQNITNPMEQQLFLLSRFFSKPMAEIGNMGIDEVKLMLDEMNVYLEKTQKEFHVSKFKEYKEESEPINSRSEILDIRRDQ